MELGDFALGFVLFLFGLFAFIGIGNSPLGIGDRTAATDDFPGNDTWSFYGTLNGSIEVVEGDLQLTSSTDSGKFISDRFTYQDRIELDKIAASVNRPGGSTEDANLTVRVYDDEGILIASDEYVLSENGMSYDVSAFDTVDDYTSYEFDIEIYNPDSQHIELESVTVDYSVINEARIPMLAETVLFLFIVAGLAVLFKR